jgi:hypothetical protein
MSPLNFTPFLCLRALLMYCNNILFHVFILTVGSHRWKQLPYASTHAQHTLNGRSLHGVRVTCI